jgi:queuine tRNA-ribosyltransferase
MMDPSNDDARKRLFKCRKTLEQTSSRAETMSEHEIKGTIKPYSDCPGHFPDSEQSANHYWFRFSGNAIGVICGETKAEMQTVLEIVDGILPEEKPRYLMGVGTPGDLINGILRGIDIFDCVLPTRLARHNAAMTWQGGRLNLVNSLYARDPSPIDVDCQCYTCQHFSRAYLRHLIMAKEMLSATLLSIHNLHTLIQLIQDIRQAIIDERLDTLLQEYSQIKESVGIAPEI